MTNVSRTNQKSYRGSGPIGKVEKVFLHYQNYSLPNTMHSGSLVKDDAIYLQADYPELFSQLGLVMAKAALKVHNSPQVYNEIRTICYGNGLFVYGGDSGVVETSTDGITWDTRTSGTTSTIYALTYGNGLFVYGSYGGPNAYIGTSTDGITWQTNKIGVSTNLSTQVSTITYGNGLFVCTVIPNNTIHTTTDPTKRTSPFYDSTTEFYVPKLMGLGASEEDLYVVAK